MQFVRIIKLHEFVSSESLRSFSSFHWKGCTIYKFADRELKLCCYLMQNGKNLQHFKQLDI